MSVEIPDWAFDDDDDHHDDDDYDIGEECGRWLDGHLSHSCTKAGSEECDWECPYRNSLRF